MTEHPPSTQQMIEHLTAEHRHHETHTHDTGRWVGGNWTIGDTVEKFMVRTTVPGVHVSTAPALVHQLLDNQPAGTGDLIGSVPTSRPAARIEAIDTLMLIDDEAARWVRRLGEDDPGDAIDPHTRQPIPGSGTIRCLLKLNGLRPATKHCGQGKSSRTETGRWCCPRHNLEADIRSWWRQARLISGWDQAATRLYNTCPICEHRGGLRVRTDSALCIECRSTWDETNLGLLAEHVRDENNDTDNAMEESA